MRMPQGVALSYVLIILTTLAGVAHCIPVYAHMMIITLCTIYIGAAGSIKEIKDEHGQPTQQPEQMQTKDAYMFPVIGSIVLFSLYLVFKFLPKEYVNLVIKLYFFIFGILVLGQKISHILSQILPLPLVKSLTSKSFVLHNPLNKVNFTFWKQPEPLTPEQQKELDEGIPLTLLDVISLGISLLVAVWYIKVNYWAASNIFGIAFSIQGIEMLSLGSYMNGLILLSGLFFYDIFWVFGTDVMVTVAKSFDAPIKLLFPQMDPALHSSMLGLGDIVIPGIFIALMMRYDYHLHTTKYAHTKTEQIPVVSTPYFWVVLFSYFIGLSTTVWVMYTFKAAQPALLYLVPACLGSTLLYAIIRGELKHMLAFSENEEKQHEVQELTTEQQEENKKSK